MILIKFSVCIEFLVGYLPNIFRMIKSNVMRWVVHVVHKKFVLNLSWKISRKRPTGKPKCVNTVKFVVHKRQGFID
jgi:hypothetical protein